MPIPDLTSGLLPPGVHHAQLVEIQIAFGQGTPRRVELFDKLQRFVSLAQSFELFTAIYVGGSFVTDKPHPGDIDAVLELPKRQDLRTLTKHPNSRAMAPALVEETYEVHLFFQAPPPPPESAGMVRLLQRIRVEDALVRGLDSDAMHGIVRVGL